MQTTVNGAEAIRPAELPEARRAAVQSGLELYQQVAADRDQLAREVERLTLENAGLKVAIEGLQAQATAMVSSVETAGLVRDQAIGDRAAFEALFIMLQASLRAFKIPNSPLITNVVAEATHGRIEHE